MFYCNHRWRNSLASCGVHVILIVPEGTPSSPDEPAVEGSLTLIIGDIFMTTQVTAQQSSATNSVTNTTALRRGPGVEAAQKKSGGIGAGASAGIIISFLIITVAGLGAILHRGRVTPINGQYKHIMQPRKSVTTDIDKHV